MGSGDKEKAPAWIWLPGAKEPTRAADLVVELGMGHWQFDYDYLQRPDAVSPDPRQLPITRSRKGIGLLYADGLPGVVRDAMPAGYGADRLDARAGRKLSPMELLESGVPDSCGAIEVCRDIEKKLAWTLQPLSKLTSILKSMHSSKPASFAVRQLHDDASTSAGGERPKVTIEDNGKLYLAKMQDRADTPFLPHKEFVVMSMATACGITTPTVRLEQIGPHAVYLCERFDRGGDPLKPTRHLYASAHTVLRLDVDAVRGDPKRSYIGLADKMRIWCRDNPKLPDDLQELWRRMAFSALVGNSDDHPRNHGLLRKDGHWGLAPAFDITPSHQFKNLLSMATGRDGSSEVSARRLIEAAVFFGVVARDAGTWLRDSSTRIAGAWEQAMRSSGVDDAALTPTSQAFVLSLKLAEHRAEIDDAVDEVEKLQRRSRLRRPA